MITPIFYGRVLEGGLLVLDKPKDYRRHLSSLRGRFVELVLRRRRTQRSLDQNAYLHAVPFPLLAESWGEDIETTKLLVMGECFGWKETRDGHRVPMKPSTSALTVEEGSHLIEWLPPWGLLNHGVSIPLPKEVDYR